MDPWLDDVKLSPGQRWKTEIPKALYASDAVIVFLSTNSITKEGFVQREMKFALDKMLEMPEEKIFLIPARLEECEVPDSLKGYEWVDLFQKNWNRRLMLSLDERAKQVGLTLSLTLEGETQAPVTIAQVESEQELELKELESQAIRFELFGKLGDALQIYYDSTAITCTLPTEN